MVTVEAVVVVVVVTGEKVVWDELTLREAAYQEKRLHWGRRCGQNDEACEPFSNRDGSA